jgi:hypothetical protein
MTATVGTIVYGDHQTFASVLVTATTTAADTATIDLGFVPSKVKTVAMTGTQAAEQFEWVNGLGTAYGIKTLTTGVPSIVSSNGITVLDTDSTVKPGRVTLGTGVLQGSAAITTVRVLAWR